MKAFSSSRPHNLTIRDGPVEAHGEIRLIQNAGDMSLDSRVKLLATSRRLVREIQISDFHLLIYHDISCFFAGETLQRPSSGKPTTLGGVKFRWRKTATVTLTSTPSQHSAAPGRQG